VRPSIDPTTSWETVREQIKDTEEFLIIETEEQRFQLFKNFLKSISDACGHHHSSSSKKKKKEKRKRKRKDEVCFIESAFINKNLHKILIWELGIHNLRTPIHILTYGG